MNIGGPARHAVILQRGLTGVGYRSLLVHGSPTEDEGSFEELLKGEGLASVRLPGLGRRVNPLDDLIAFWALLRLVVRERPDVIHTHTAKAGTLGRLAGVLANLVPGRRRSLLVHTFHGHVFAGYFGPAGSRVVRTIERGLARVTDRIVTISERQREDIVGTFHIAPAAKVTVIPLGLELDGLLGMTDPPRELRTALGWTAHEFVVGFVGRLVPIKDIPTLVRGFSVLHAARPEARLVVVGDGECRAEAEQLARDLDLDPFVRFVGWQRDLRDIYGSVDAVALTSRNEGTPVALIEAMAAGRPVVATAVGGVPDVVADGETGLLVPSGDPAALGSALERLAASAQLRAQLGSAGRRAVADRFGDARLVRDVDALYRQLLASR